MTGVPAAYGVPAASAGDIAAGPPDLIVSGRPNGDDAKLFVAEIADPDVVHGDVSSSATNASVNALAIRSGYSSERKRTSNERHVASGAPAGLRGTLKPVWMDVTSMAVSPRVRWGPPPSSTLGNTPGRSSWSPRVASPVDRTRNVLPSRGNPGGPLPPIPTWFTGGGGVTNAP